MWELYHKEDWVPNWCFWTAVLEKTLESPVDCKEIKPVNPKRNQPWIFIGGTDTKAPCNAGDPGLIPGWGRSPGGGNGDPLQYSCLKNPMDRRAWQGTVQEASESQIWLKNWACTQCKMTEGIPGRNISEEEGFLSKASKTILLGYGSEGTQRKERFGDSCWKDKTRRGQVSRRKGCKGLCLTPRSFRGAEWPTFCKLYIHHSLNIAGAQGQCHPQSEMTSFTSSQFTSDGHPARRISHSPIKRCSRSVCSAQKKKKWGPPVRPAYC